MPENLTDDPSNYPAQLQAPIGSDARKAVSMQVPLQQIANRTSANKARIDNIAPGSGGAPGGVQVLSYVADIATLKTLTGTNRTNRGICLVADGAQLFQYLSDLTSNNPPYDIQPNDTIGTWRAIGYGQWNVANGLASLNSAARIDAAKVVNGIIATAGAVFGTVGSLYGSTTSTTYVDIGAGPAQVVLTGAAVGDAIMVRASVPYIAPSGAGGKLALTVTDSAGTTIVQEVSIPVNVTSTQTLLGRYVVTHSGTQTVKVRYLSLSGAATQTANGVISIDAILIRP